MDFLAEIRTPIADDLARYRELFLGSLTCDNPLLGRALSHLSQRTGKMMRPTLGLLSARAFGEVNERVLHAMVALELLHTASLVHDDVLDESDERRGQASVNALMHNTEAVLVGDFLLSRALEHAAKAQDVGVVADIARLGQTLADGELLQIYNTGLTDLDEASYYQVIERKTASLFVCSARLGAFLAGGRDNEVETMAAFGRLIGLCFQLRDDIFDYLPTASLGKPTGVDMREGKLTLPILYAARKSTDEAWRKKALRVRRGGVGEQEIADLMEFAIREGGIEYAYAAIESRSKEAEALLAVVENADIRRALSLYNRFVAQRNV